MNIVPAPEPTHADALRALADTVEQRADAMDVCELHDTRWRINNLLQHGCPVDELTIDEAKAVLATLAGVFRARQGDCTLTVVLTIKSPSGGPDIITSDWSLPKSEA
jgi:hypothetical protein